MNCLARLCTGNLVLVLVALHFSAAAAPLVGDLDYSGGIDARDVQLILNAALGVEHRVNADVDYNGVCNAIDLQIVTNAVLGHDVDSDGDGICDAGEPNVDSDNTDSPIGSNLSRFGDWVTEWPFIDCFKQSRPWTSGAAGVFDDGRPLDLDANGWVKSLLPDQMAKTLIFWYENPVGKYPAGQYTVLYDGEGAIEYRTAAEKDENLSIPGRDIIKVNPAKGGIQLFITETNPGNYIRNIRVITPGGVSVHDPYVWTNDNDPPDPENWSLFIDNYETQVFHPAFLRTTRKYSVLRFMNWQITNEPDARGVTERLWADRARTTDARWVSRGIPVEIMCELANRLRANPWFCVHHLSTDEYIAGFAAIVRDTLDPELKAYVEHSNEVWNDQYAQAGYCREKGAALGLSHDTFQAQLFCHSLRSVHIFSIWENTFGDAQRLVRVMGSQAANPWVSEQALVFNEAYLDCDALAVAPYFDVAEPVSEDQPVLEAMTVDELLLHLKTHSLPRSADWIVRQKAVADEYGVDLVAYEGGQHLVWGRGWVDNDPINALFDAANRDPRMGDLYVQHLNDWFGSGGGVFVNFLNCMNWGQYGRWGNLESFAHPRAIAPKYDAVHRFIEQWQREQ